MAKDKIYQQVAAFLRKNIASGTLKVGDAIYSENLLCEKLGVSRTSVRRAIRMMVDENILVSHQGKGTFVRSNGKGIIHGTLGMLNLYTRVLQYDITDSYYSDIIYGAEAATRERELDFSLFSKEFHTESEARKLFSKLKYDGVIVDGAFLMDSGKYNFLSDIFPNLVYVDGNPEECSQPVAAPDAEKGFTGLIELAVKRSGPIFFVGQESTSIFRWKKECFFRAAKKAGVDFTYIDYSKNIKNDIFDQLFHIHGDYNPLIYEAVKRIAVPGNVGGTIIATCDYTAVKTMSSLIRLGYSIPRDFAVCGFGGIGFSSYTVPALTTVKVDSSALSRIAVDMLLAKIENREIPSGLLDVGVIKRDSL